MGKQCFYISTSRIMCTNYGMTLHYNNINLCLRNLCYCYINSRSYRKDAVQFTAYRWMNIPRYTSSCHYVVSRGTTLHVQHIRKHYANTYCICIIPSSFADSCSSERKE